MNEDKVGEGPGALAAAAPSANELIKQMRTELLWIRDEVCPLVRRLTSRGVVKQYLDRFPSLIDDLVVSQTGSFRTEPELLGRMRGELVWIYNNLWPLVHEGTDQETHQPLKARLKSLSALANTWPAGTIRVGLAPTAAAPSRAEAVIDLDALAWAQIKQAASESTWMPPEYMANDWLSDVCDFLRKGPGDFDVREVDSQPEIQDGVIRIDGRHYDIETVRTALLGLAKDVIVRDTGDVEALEDEPEGMRP